MSMVDPTLGSVSEGSVASTYPPGNVIRTPVIGEWSPPGCTIVNSLAVPVPANSTRSPTPRSNGVIQALNRELFEFNEQVIDPDAVDAAVALEMRPTADALGAQDAAALVHEEARPDFMTKLLDDAKDGDVQQDLLKTGGDLLSRWLK